MIKEEKEKELRKLKQKMEGDKLLPLKKGATRLVFGVGSAGTEILLIGEGPGYWEDQRGEPFVGNAGKLLDQLLHKIDLDRSKVYITNVVHHRPPQNRDPEPSEIAAYKPYLDKIIEIIDPKIIVTLGRFSMAKFIPGVFISNVHGKESKITVNGKEVWAIPMYHPAAALRSTEIKTKLERDFGKIQEVLEKAEIIESDQVEKEKKDSEQIQLI